MPVSRVPHLMLRGRTYYFRRAVPGRLQTRFGRASIKASLRTHNRVTAILRCRVLSCRFELLIEAAERMQTLTTERINELVQSYFNSKLEVANEVALFGPDDDRFDPDDEIAGMELEIDVLRQRIAKRAYDTRLQGEANELIETGGYELPSQSSEEFDRVCNGILRADAEQRRVLIEMLRGAYDRTAPLDPLFSGITHTALPPLPNDTKTAESKTLSVLVEKYCALKQDRDWVLKTYHENQRVLGWFSELVGGERPITYITTDDVREFRDVLKNVPANFNYADKASQYVGLTLKEAGDQSPKEDRLAVGTVQKYFGCVRAFLKWCDDEDYVPNSPAQKVKVPAKSNPQDARHPFSEEQLTTLFTSPQYTGHMSHSSRWKAGKLIERDGKFWIPLVALYSGMRLGEIVQLRVADIKRKDEVDYFDVTRGEGEHKKLKTASSERVVPIHPELVHIGLLQHVESQRLKDPTGRVFPDIKKGANGYFSHNFSKFFSRYAERVGMKSAKTSFHSFRHNFKDALVAGGVEDSHIRALLGHSDTSTTSIYGSKMGPGLLYNDICHVAYGLDLKHLKNATSD